MKNTLAWIGLATLVATIPVDVVAATSLRGIMHSWRAEARSAHSMLSGRAAFDEGAIRNTLQTYIEDAGRIAAQVNGGTAAARDIKQRFAAFQVDAEAALGNLGRRPALKAGFSRLMSDCQSCHDSFNN